MACYHLNAVAKANEISLEGVKKKKKQSSKDKFCHQLITFKCCDWQLPKREINLN